MPVLSGVSYRGYMELRHIHSQESGKRRANRRSPVALAFRSFPFK